MRRILKQGQEASLLARVSRGVTVRNWGPEVNGWTTKSRKGLQVPRWPSSQLPSSVAIPGRCTWTYMQG